MDDMREFCAYACGVVVVTKRVRLGWMEWTYHGLDVGMWYSVELVVFQFEFWTDVDIGALVLGTVAVLGCGED